MEALALESGVKVVKPPEMPPSLVFMKIDPQSLCVSLEQSPIQSLFRKYRDYIRDLNEQSIEHMKSEIELQTRAVDAELRVFIEQKVSDVENRLERKIQVATSNDLSAEVRGLEERVSRFSDKINSAIDVASQAMEVAQDIEQKLGHKIEEAITAHTAAQPEVTAKKSQVKTTTQRESSESPVPTAETADEKEPARVRPSSRNMSDPTSDAKGLEESPVIRNTVGGDQSRRLSGERSSLVGKQGRASAQSALQGIGIPVEQVELLMRLPEEIHLIWEHLEQLPEQLAASTGDMAHHAEELQALAEELHKVQELQSTNAERVRVLEGKVESEFSQTEEQLKKCDENLTFCKQLATTTASKLEVERISVQELQERVKSMCIELDHISKAKANVDPLDQCIKDLTDLTVRVGSFATSAFVEEHVGKWNRGIEALSSEVQRYDGASTEFKQRQEAQVEELQKATQRHFEQSASLEHMVQEHIQKYEVSTCQMREDILQALSNITQLWELNKVVGSKADQADMVSLRTAVSTITAELKDKERSVLFGARCLSCNRVFDDVQQDAGVVDVRGDRQREKLYSEVQRALHDPKVDPNKPVKMIAVKVGRPGNVATNSPSNRGGMYQGRDWASMSCGVEDIQLVPAFSSAERASTSGSSARPATTRAESTMSTTTPTSSPVRSARGKPREIVQNNDGPYDFKHPLSSLVDRGRLPLTSPHGS